MRAERNPRAVSDLQVGPSAGCMLGADFYRVFLYPIRPSQDGEDEYYYFLILYTDGIPFFTFSHFLFLSSS